MVSVGRREGIEGEKKKEINGEAQTHSVFTTARRTRNSQLLLNA